MPSVSESLDTTALRARATVTIPIDNVLIRSASVINLTDAAPPADCFCEVGIMSGGTNQENRIAVLASGYVGEFNPISWFGELTGDATHFIYVNSFASAVYNLRLTVLSEAR